MSTTHDPEDVESSADEGAAVTVARTPGPVDAPLIACTLDDASMSSRLDDWRRLLARVASRFPLPNGVRLTFESGAPIGEVARLVEAERECCRFLSFAITVDERGTALEVTAPEDARPIVDDLFGVARRI